MYRIVSLLCLLGAALPASAQQPPSGRVAGSVAGTAGERRTSDQEVGGIEPMARINSRVQNRVQNRIRNRIDRYYDPQANAASPFLVAGNEARTAGRSGRR